MKFSKKASVTSSRNSPRTESFACENFIKRSFPRKPTSPPHNCYALISHKISMQAHQSFYSKYAKYFRGWKVMEVEKRLVSVDLTTSSEKFLIQTRMLRKWFAEYGLTTSSWHPPTSTVRRSLEQCTARAQTRSVISQRVIVKGSTHRNSPPHRAEQTNTSSRPLQIPS